MSIGRNLNAMYITAAAVCSFMLSNAASAALASSGQKGNSTEITDRGALSASAELHRVVALQRGSNFRELGGYRASGGREVRRGLIYRSGALAFLSDADVAKIKALGVQRVVDLRSSEERIMAPGNLDGVVNMSIGYSITDLTPMDRLSKLSSAETINDTYRTFPIILAPQLRLIFTTLLQNPGPLVYHCSAGQDRTGFASAMVLAALGVPKSTIYEDYLLSSKYRRPQFEFPLLDAANYPEPSFARMMAEAQKSPGYFTPAPLRDEHGPYLRIAFDEIEARWGSLENYLRDEIGLSRNDIDALRRIYLN